MARELATTQQVMYAELTCTPYTSVLPGDPDHGIPIEAYTEAIEDARLAAERYFGIVLRWLYDPANRKAAIELTAGYLKRPPVSFESWLFTNKDLFRDMDAKP